jgi:hypothetical protein
MGFSKMYMQKLQTLYVITYCYLSDRAWRRSSDLFQSAMLSFSVPNFDFYCTITLFKNKVYISKNLNCFFFISSHHSGLSILILFKTCPAKRRVFVLINYYGMWYSCLSLVFITLVRLNLSKNFFVSYILCV